MIDAAATTSGAGDGGDCGGPSVSKEDKDNKKDGLKRQLDDNGQYSSFTQLANLLMPISIDSSISLDLECFVTGCQTALRYCAYYLYRCRSWWPLWGGGHTTRCSDSTQEAKDWRNRELECGGISTGEICHKHGFLSDWYNWKDINWLGLEILILCSEGEIMISSPSYGGACHHKEQSISFHFFELYAWSVLIESPFGELQHIRVPSSEWGSLTLLMRILLWLWAYNISDIHHKGNKEQIGGDQYAISWRKAPSKAFLL